MAAMERLKRRIARWVDDHFDPELRAEIKRLEAQGNEYGYDPFGFCLEDAKVALYVAAQLYRHYFRAEVHGIEQVPDGRLLLAANHSGQLPFDGLCIACALMLDRKPPRVVRSMVERFVPDFPFLSYLLPRWGQILGSPENCERLLDAGEAILVFPEGVRGISKPFTKRYQLQPFGNGFLRLALKTKTPVLPVAVVGAEEQAPGFNAAPIARLLGVPAFPLMPLPPFVPIVPYPSKYRIYFGEPRLFEGDHEDDDEALDGMVQEVRRSIESMLHAGLKERKHIFW